jgi:hypothetical protein
MADWKIELFISIYATKVRANARDMGLRILYSRGGNPQGHNKQGEARKDNRGFLDLYSTRINLKLSCIILFLSQRM